ncbi:hypothetical protein ACFW61_08380 [Streptomyces microflavus]
MLDTAHLADEEISLCSPGTASQRPERSAGSPDVEDDGRLEDTNDGVSAK